MKLPARRRTLSPQVRITMLLTTAFVLVVALIATYGLRCLLNGYLDGDVYMKNAPLRRGFDGLAKDLKRTVIVPTLETLVPAHKNVVWTAAHAIGWRALRERLGRAVMATAAEPERAAQLDRAADIDHASRIAERYTYLGPASEGRSRIASELPLALPGSPVPALEDAPGLLAFSYLRINVAFPVRLAKDFYSEWRFVDSLGQTTPTSFFGITASGRQSLRLLYADRAPGCDFFDDKSIVDASPQSLPYQVVLAGVPLGDSLASTLSDAESKIASFAREHDESDGSFREWRIGLDAPSIFFRIREHHDELAVLGDVGRSRVDSRQTIELELNQPTATNQSEWLASLSDVPCFPQATFQAPFLLYIRQRGTREPFLVIWLDNPELVSPQPPAWPSILRAFW
jgi:hypothetical protein